MTGRDGMADTDDEAVVVPAVRSGSSLTCVRSLGRQGVTPVVASEFSNPPSARSRYCGEFHTVPSPWLVGLEEYGDALLSLARRSDVRTVVPVHEPDSYVLADRRDEFAAHVGTPWPSFDTVRTAQDRLRLFDLADSVGVPTPTTAPVDEWTERDEPTVVKSRYSILVEDGMPAYPEVRFFGPDERLDVDRIVDEMGHTPIAQSYVPGDEEFGFFACYDHGDPVATFQHRRVRSYSYAGGASVFRRAHDDPDLAAAGRRLLDELDWHGPAMVEFKRDPRDGSYRLMEINPRFWGSLALPVAAGVDFPGTYYRLATGRPTGPPPDYRAGVGCHVLHGEASHLYSVLTRQYGHRDPPSFPRRTAEVAASLLTDRNFDYLSVDDPAPFLAVFGSALGDGVERAVDSIRRAVGTPTPE